MPCNCVSGWTPPSLPDAGYIRIIYTKQVFFEDILMWGIDIWHKWYSRSYFSTIHVYIQILKSGIVNGIRQEEAAGRWGFNMEGLTMSTLQCRVCISGWPLLVNLTSKAAAARCLLFLFSSFVLLRTTDHVYIIQQCNKQALLHDSYSFCSNKTQNMSSHVYCFSLQSTKPLVEVLELSVDGGQVTS